METILYVVRHGQSEANRDSIISGHFDTPLTDEGRKQAAAAARKLKNVKFDAAYSSDLKRAIETAEIIYGQELDTANHIFNLRERSFGALEGKENVHLQKLFEDHRLNKESLNEKELWEYQVAQDMESDHTLSTRFTEALAQIAEDNPGKTVLVAAHGGGIRTMLIKLGHGKVSDYPPGSFKNAGYVKLIYQNGKLTVDEVEGVDRKHTTSE